MCSTTINRHAAVTDILTVTGQTKIVVCFLLGNFPASEFYIPTFRNILFHFHRRMPMKVEQCSETSADKIQRPVIYPEESIQHSEHGESLK